MQSYTFFSNNPQIILQFKQIPLILQRYGKAESHHQ